MWLFFVPAVILSVLILSAVTAGVFAFGVGWPVLLIVLGIWMLSRGDGHRSGHRHRKRSERWQQYASSSARPAADPQVKPKSKPVSPELRQSELPIDVKVKVEQIRRKVDVLLGYADRFPPFSQDLYLVRQTASEYLPRTIDTYLALPLEAAEKPMPGTGKTPHQELKSQLDLLDAKLDDIAQDLQRQDTDRLLANRRFLQERFNLRNGAASMVDAPTGP
jgi:hypothetical protein